MPSCWAPRDGRDEHIEELEKENERLRNDIAWQEERNANNVMQCSEQLKLARDENERLRAALNDPASHYCKELQEENERLRAEVQHHIDRRREVEEWYHKAEAKIESALDEIAAQRAGASHGGIERIERALLGGR